MALLMIQLRANGVPMPTHEELRFAPPRRWRADLAWLPDRLLVELDGGVWSRGRHVRPEGYIRDAAKLNAAVCLGWRVLRFPSPMIGDGTAWRTIRDALAIDPASPLDLTGVRV